MAGTVCTSAARTAANHPAERPAAERIGRTDVAGADISPAHYFHPGLRDNPEM
jgi:hypothetical protein